MAECRVHPESCGIANLPEAHQQQSGEAAVGQHRVVAGVGARPPGEQPHEAADGAQPEARAVVAVVTADNFASAQKTWGKGSAICNLRFQFKQNTLKRT